jgi:glutamate synthase (NADPH/NADH) small chain
MGDPRGFLNIKREAMLYRPVCERVKDYEEIGLLRSEKASLEQASRCMDCGTPFCLWGCPLANLIPEWNDLMFRKQWKKAFELLQATNNFPEFTGRLCPALCEYACVLGINDEPVTIRENELAIIEYAFEHGFVKPNPPAIRTGKKVAVIGSGPAGLTCADELNKSGHKVIVFEKDDKIGGILRYGMPDFKLEKHIIDRRLAILKKEGIIFETSANIDINNITKLKKDFDAICFACGSRTPRDLNIEGRYLKGIYFAMDYLTRSNKRIPGEKIDSADSMDANGKRVVVLGGGDTGADCVGVAHRQGAKCVIQIELLPKPSEERPENQPWPIYPIILKNSTSHEEGGERKWSILTKKFLGENGCVKKLSCVQIDTEIKEIPGTEFEIDADLAILALGFLSPEKRSAEKGVFYAGDMRTGSSLIVKAMSDGRNTARAIAAYLK